MISVLTAYLTWNNKNLKPFVLKKFSFFKNKLIWVYLFFGLIYISISVLFTASSQHFLSGANDTCVWSEKRSVVKLHAKRPFPYFLNPQTLPISEIINTFFSFPCSFRQNGGFLESAQCSFCFQWFRKEEKDKQEKNRRQPNTRQKRKKKLKDTNRQRRWKMKERKILTVMWNIFSSMSVAPARLFGIQVRNFLFSYTLLHIWIIVRKCFWLETERNNI